MRDPLKDIVDEGPRGPQRSKRGRLVFLVFGFGALFALAFLGEVWTAHAARRGLEATLGPGVRLVAVKDEARVTCGSYRLAGDSHAWLFVEDRAGVWPQSRLAGQMLTDPLEREYTDCDTYEDTHSYERGPVRVFEREALALANWL